MTSLPTTYATTLAELKERIRSERLRVVLTANAAMILLYWDLGRVILARQEAEGWGAKVIDRLSQDLRAAFPDMSGLSPRNLAYMRTFAAAWPDRSIVQRAAAQIPWRQNQLLLDRVPDAAARRWYVEKVREEGWSRNVLALQLDGRLHGREGQAVHTTPPLFLRRPPTSPPRSSRTRTSSTSSAPPTPGARPRSSRPSWTTSSASCWSSA